MAKELIRLVGCTMEFDGETILNSIDLQINDKEFLTLLGPSGCGKTTTIYRPTKDRSTRSSSGMPFSPIWTYMKTSPSASVPRSCRRTRSTGA